VDPSAAELVISQAHATLQVDEKALERIVHCLMRAEGRKWQYLSIVFTDNETVHDLNRTYLGHDYVTDVISFDLSEGGPESDPANVIVSGEVYVDLDTAAERHEDYGCGLEEEALRYAIHGLLHLLGYEDATADEKEHMHVLEDTYLRCADKIDAAKK